MRKKKKEGSRLERVLIGAAELTPPVAAGITIGVSRALDIDEDLLIAAYGSAGSLGTTTYKVIRGSYGVDDSMLLPFQHAFVVGLVGFLSYGVAKAYLAFGCK